MKLHLHIDRLVIADGRSLDPAKLAEAVQTALRERLERAPHLLGPEFAAGAAVPAVAPVSAPPLTRAGLPGTIADAIVATLRGRP